MKKLLGVFLLWIAFLASDFAHAASRFLTCLTACTITAADTSIWGTSSGGTGASVPGSGDDVILDAGTCVGGGTCTATMGAAYNPTWLTFTQSACTATTTGCIFDANPNTNTITLTAANGYANTGSGTRTTSGGTWVLSNNGAIWNIATSATITNSPSVNFSGTGGTASRRFLGAGTKVYGTITVAAGSAAWNMTGTGNTITTLTIGAGQRIMFPAGATTTVTTFTNVSGSSSTPTVFLTESPTNGVATISSANNWTCDWCGFGGMTFSGGGTFSATNAANYGNNTNIIINAPSGGATPHIIGSGI